MQLSYNIDEVQALTGVGRTRLYEAMKEGKLKARKFGNKTMILKRDLEEFLDNLPTYGAEDKAEA